MGVPTAPENEIPSGNATDSGMSPNVKLLKVSTKNAPHFKILSYDGVTATRNGKTSVVGRTPLSIKK